MGGAYRLYAYNYELADANQISSGLGPASGGIVCARQISVLQVWPDDWPQMKELASVGGDSSRRLLFDEARDCTLQHLREILEVRMSR